jgi:hypothetical protein
VAGQAGGAATSGESHRPPADKNKLRVGADQAAELAAAPLCCTYCCLFQVAVFVYSTGEKVKQMNMLSSMTVSTAVTVACCVPAAFAQPVAQRENEPLQAGVSEPFLLSPPSDGGPVEVYANFQLHQINEIDDEAETFEFTGVLTLRWLDKRQAFKPAKVGVTEKVYQGGYQFNELSAGWFPQVNLVNEVGSCEMSGVVLRVLPDGSSTLVQTVNANAKTELSMRRFPFDRHRLEAVYEVLGFDSGEVALQAEAVTADLTATGIRIPQWTIADVDLSTRDRRASYAGRRGVTSALVVGIEAQRRPVYMVRLVLIPLMMIVVLSFSVFWMDRSSLGDRISVSFIGILTVVAYQLVTSDTQPRIAYVTLMHGLTNLSFLTVCATVVINLVVGTLDKRGKPEVGHRVDRRCRWIFPLTYFGLSLVIVVAAFLFL